MFMLNYQIAGILRDNFRRVEFKPSLIYAIYKDQVIRLLIESGSE